MMNIEKLFDICNTVRGYYLDKITQAYDGEITELRYVSKYDETISVNIISDGLDKMFIKFALLGCEDNCELSTITESLTKAVEKRVKYVLKERTVKKESVTKESGANSEFNNILIAKLQEQMVKALESGDFETYDKLEERLNRLN